MAALQTILDRANALTQEAVDLDQRGDLAKAIAKYDDATHLLVLVAQHEADEEKVVATVGQIEAIRGRIETLKAALADFVTRLSQSQSGNSINSSSYTTEVSQSGSIVKEEGRRETEKPSPTASSLDEKGKEKEKESETLKSAPNLETQNTENSDKVDNSNTSDFPPTASDYKHKEAASAPSSADVPNISSSPKPPEEWAERMVLVGVVVYEVFDQNKTRRTLLDGTNPLEVLVRDPNLILFSESGEFSYELTSRLPCLSLHEANGRIYLILPSLQRQQFYALLLPTTMPKSEVASLERLLSQYSMFKRQIRGVPKNSDPNMGPSSSGDQPSVTHPVDIVEDWEVVNASIQEESDSALALIPAQELAQRTLTSQKISSVAVGIETGGEYIAKGIIAGGELLSSTIQKGSVRFKEQVTPNETATEVPDAVKNTFRKAKEISPQAVKISAAVSDGLSYIAGEIAVSIAKGIKHATSSSSGEINGFFSDPRVKAAGEVGMAGLGAFGSIFAALEKAAVTVIEGTSEATADVLEHKFGEEVGSVARDGFAVGVDAVKTVNNVTSLRPKKIAKSIAFHSAKEAGKAYVGIEDKKRPIALLGDGSAVTVDAVDSDEESERRLYAALTQSTTAEDRDSSVQSIEDSHESLRISSNLAALVASTSTSTPADPIIPPSSPSSHSSTSSPSVMISESPSTESPSSTQMPTVTDAD